MKMVYNREYHDGADFDGAAPTVPRSAPPPARQSRSKESAKGALQEGD